MNPKIKRSNDNNYFCLIKNINYRLMLVSVDVIRHKKKNNK